MGDVSPRYPGVSAEALATSSVGLNYPTMAGLLVLPSLGLLFAGDAEGAYRAAFFDVGYAREATALLAALCGYRLLCGHCRRVGRGAVGYWRAASSAGRAGVGSESGGIRLRPGADGRAVCGANAGLDRRGGF